MLQLQSELLYFAFLASNYCLLHLLLLHQLLVAVLQLVYQKLLLHNRFFAFLNLLIGLPTEVRVTDLFLAFLWHKFLYDIFQSLRLLGQLRILFFQITNLLHSQMKFKLWWLITWLVVWNMRCLLNGFLINLDGFPLIYLLRELVLWAFLIYHKFALRRLSLPRFLCIFSRFRIVILLHYSIVIKTLRTIFLPEILLFYRSLFITLNGLVRIFLICIWLFALSFLWVIRFNWNLAFFNGDQLEFSFDFGRFFCFSLDFSNISTSCLKILVWWRIYWPELK